MIYRTTQNPADKKNNPLQRLRNRVAEEPAMNLSILDMSQDGDTLVVLCSDNCMITLIKMALEKHWPGEMEVYCVLDVATGGSPLHQDIEYQDTRSTKYLN
jgi:hypothetical protein